MICYPQLYTQTTSYDGGQNTFPDVPFGQTVISSAFFLRKLLKHVLHQNEGVNQEKGRTSGPGAPRQRKANGNGEGRSQDGEGAEAWQAANPDWGRGQRLRKYKKNEPTEGPAQLTTLLRGI